MKTLLAVLLFASFASAQVLTWSDEFNQPDGSVPDPSKWSYETGPCGCKSNELQYDTSRPQNVQIQNGNLVITAYNENYQGYTYPSGRINTLNNFSQLYGRFDARMKLPWGKGTHVAFWMMGTDRFQSGWPGCGEIDVGEYIGRWTNILIGAIHGPGYTGSNVERSVPLPAATSAFHVYSVTWRPNLVQFSVDGTIWKTLTPASMPYGSTWEFNKPFYLLLSMSIGGNFAGTPDPSAFPQSLLVDYVRVYQ